MEVSEIKSRAKAIRAKMEAETDPLRFALHHAEAKEVLLELMEELGW